MADLDSLRSTRTRGEVAALVAEHRALKVAVLDLLEHPDPGEAEFWSDMTAYRKAYMRNEAAVARLKEVLMIP